MDFLSNIFISYFTFLQYQYTLSLVAALLFGSYIIIIPFMYCYQTIHLISDVTVFHCLHIMIVIPFLTLIMCMIAGFFFQH